MAGERSPIPYETRQAVLRMRKGGASYDEISTALKVSKTWISRFLRRREEEPAQLRGASARAAILAPPAAGAAPAAPSAPAAVVRELVIDDDAVAPGDETSATGRNIGELEEELRTLYRLANQADDPLERAKISTAISSITARLAALRRDEAKARPGAADDLVKRAGQAAADKLRKLVEEALGEVLPEDEAS